MNPSAAGKMKKKYSSKLSTGSMSSVRRLAESIPDCKIKRSVRPHKKSSLKKKKKTVRTMKPSGSCKRSKKRKSTKSKTRAVSRPVGKPRSRPVGRPVSRSLSRKKSKPVPKKRTVRSRSIPAYNYRTFSNRSLYRQQYLDGNGFYNYNSRPRRVYAPQQTTYCQRPIYGDTLPPSPLACYPTSQNTNHFLQPSTRYNETSSYPRSYNDAFYPSTGADSYYPDEYSMNEPNHYDDLYLDRRPSSYDRYDSYNDNYMNPSAGYDPPSYDSACMSDEDSLMAEEADYYDDIPQNDYLMPSAGGYRDEYEGNNFLFPSAGVKRSDTSVSTNDSRKKCLQPSAGVKRSDTSVSSNGSKKKCLQPSAGVRKSDTSVDTNDLMTECLQASAGVKTSNTSVNTDTKGSMDDEKPSETCLNPSAAVGDSKTSLERRDLQDEPRDDFLYPSAAVRDSNTSLESRRGFRDEQLDNDCLYPSVRRSETSACTEETESMMSDDDSVATDQLLLQPSARYESESAMSESVVSESNESQASSAESALMFPSARQANRRSYQDEDIYDDDDISDSYYSEDTETSLVSEDYSAGNEDPAGLESMPIASQGINRDDSYLDSYSEDDATESCLDDEEESVASSEYYDDDQMQY